MSSTAVPWVLFSIAAVIVIILLMSLYSKSNEITELKAEIEKLNTEIKSLKKQVEEAKANKEAADKLSKDAKIEADKKIEDAKAEADKKIADAKAGADKKIEDANKEAIIKISQAKDETSKAVSAEAKAAADKKIADATAEANAKINQANAAAAQEIRQAKAAAEQKINQATAASDAAAASVATLQTQIGQVNIKLAAYDKFLSDLKALLGTLNNSSIDAAGIINMDITNGLTVVDNMLKAKNKQISDLQQSKGVSTGDAVILNALLSANNNSLQAVQSNMDALKTSNANLNTQLQGLARNINDSMNNILTASINAPDNNASLMVPTNPAGGIVNSSYTANQQTLDALATYVKTTRAVLNKVLADTTLDNKPTSINNVGDLLSIINGYNTRINNLQTQLTTANNELNMLRSKYMRVGNRIPVRHLKDTILFGYDINTFRPNSPVDNFYYNVFYNDDALVTAPYVCNNSLACTSYTMNATPNVLEFPKMESTVIATSQKDENIKICPTGYITNVRDFWVQDADRSDTRGFLPNNGLGNQLLGKYQIKLNDLVDSDGTKLLDRYYAKNNARGVAVNKTNEPNTPHNLAEYRKWGVTVDCVNNPNLIYNSNMKPDESTGGVVLTDADGRHNSFIRSKSRIFAKNDNWNVGITRPEDIDWGATLGANVNAFDYKNENGSDTIDFTKVGDVSRGPTKGVLFLNTEVAGTRFGEEKAVMNLGECINHLNALPVTAGYNKVAMIQKEPYNNWKYNCFGFTDNSATDKLTLRRNTLGSRFHNSYVFPNISNVPNFDF
jgi:F0F1-type ATP synthase membrane subunit b/b'